MKKRILNRKRIWKCALLCGAILALIFFLITLLCRAAVKNTLYPFYWQGEQKTLSKKYDYILVPGAQVGGGKPQAHLQDRLDTAVALYRQGCAEKIILSGGYNEEQKLWEPLVMMAYLDEAGIPREAMVLDQGGFDTAETLRRTKALVGEGKVLICTQSQYAPRTAYLAQKFNLRAEVADSDIRIYTIGVLKGQVREYFAATKAVFEGAFAKKCRKSLAELPMKGGEEYA